MLHLITGGFGSGKSRFCERAIADCVAGGHPARLIVPEQSTVAAEHRMAELLPPSAPLIFEVCNFTRLADTVFRLCGGIGVRYCSPAARSLLMWETLGELRPLLHGTARNEAGQVKLMQNAEAELAAGRITPGALDAAAASLGEGKLAERLEDLSLVLSVYRRLLEERYAERESCLDAMAERLRVSPVFAGETLFLDGFTSYTEQQYAVLGELLRECEVYLTLTIPPDAAASLCYEETAETERRLKALAKKMGVEVKTVELKGFYRSESDVLRFLAENLWKTDSGSARFQGEASDSLRCFSVADPYAAASLVASDILRRVEEEGALYRDFAVLTADTESYRGILDDALAGSGIPCFSSRRTALSSLEPIKLIVSAYAVISGGFRRSDLLTYLKCGFSGISQRDIDEFELYTAKWKLTGAKLRSETPWTMNPNGYTDRITPWGEEMLARVNQTRERVIRSFSPLADLNGSRTVGEHCRILCDFLLSLGLPRLLNERAVLAGEMGDPERAEQFSRLWQIICGVFDTLAEVLPDASVDNDTFASLFSMVAAEVNIGRIPESEDEVLIGSAEMLRAGGVRHVYLLGVNDGEFPAPVGESGFFTEQERATLLTLGLPVGSDGRIRASRSLFHFLRALTSASVSATVITTALNSGLSPTRPSQAIVRMREMLGDRMKTVNGDDLPPLDLLYSANAAAERLGELKSSPVFPPLSAALTALGGFDSRLQAALLPIANSSLHLSPAIAEALYPRDMAMTQSRVEKYVHCPFSHFCTYVLKLHPEEHAEFDNSEIGSFVHAMLERFFRRGAKSPGEYTAEEIKTLSRELSDEYLREIGQGQEKSPRIRHLWDNLNRTSSLLIGHICDEMRSSDFTPRFFELEIGHGGDDAPSPYPFPTSDGGTLSLYGTIDRVDVCRIGKRVYLRVVDYKTGTKEFRLEDVYRGLNLQMLLYLFTLWKNRNPAFLERLGVPEGGEVLPAGILYMNAYTGEIPLDRPASVEETLSAADAKLRQNGLLLHDQTVLSAMEHGLGGRFLPIALGKDGTLPPVSKYLASLDRLGELLEDVSAILSGITDEMKRGEIPAHPSSTPGDKNCEYCDMKPICRVRN